MSDEHVIARSSVGQTGSRAEHVRPRLKLRNRPEVTDVEAREVSGQSPRRRVKIKPVSEPAPLSAAAPSASHEGLLAHIATHPQVRTSLPVANEAAKRMAFCGTSILSLRLYIYMLSQIGQSTRILDDGSLLFDGHVTDFTRMLDEHHMQLIARGKHRSLMKFETHSANKPRRIRSYFSGRSKQVYRTLRKEMRQLCVRVFYRNVKTGEMREQEFGVKRAHDMPAQIDRSTGRVQVLLDGEVLRILVWDQNEARTLFSLRDFNCVRTMAGATLLSFLSSVRGFVREGKRKAFPIPAVEAFRMFDVEPGNWRALNKKLKSATMDVVTNTDWRLVIDKKRRGRSISDIQVKVLEKDRLIADRKKSPGQGAVKSGRAPASPDTRHSLTNQPRRIRQPPGDKNYVAPANRRVTDDVPDDYQ
jgi:hypothetical protein